MSQFKVGIIYASDNKEEVFYSPDGVSCIWYDSVDEAIESAGDLPVQHGWNWGEQGYDSFGQYVGEPDPSPWSL